VQGLVALRVMQQIKKIGRSEVPQTARPSNDPVWDYLFPNRQSQTGSCFGPICWQLQVCSIIPLNVLHWPMERIEHTAGDI